MSTWLITGATGLLGSNAAIQLHDAYSVVGAARAVPVGAPVPFISVDLSEARSRDGLVEKSAAKIVLHSAAISSINACEEDPALAHEVNVAASADLAQQAHDVGAKFIYISTDAVFDGQHGAYSEYDEPSPDSEYGRTKLAGEAAVLEANPEALVARVNFFGWSPNGQRSLAEFFYHRLERGERVPGFDDVVVSTLYVGYLVKLLERLVIHNVHGIVNVVSSESTTKYDFGRRLAKTFGFDDRLVYRAKSSDHLAVKRGSRIDLSTNKIRALLTSNPPNQQEGMDQLLADHRRGQVNAVASFRTR